MYLTNNIRHLRKTRKWTQDELADKIGVTSASISAYEKAKTMPSIDVLIKLSSAFQVSVDSLVLNDLELEGISKSKGVIFEPQSREDKNKFQDRFIELLEHRINQLETEILKKLPEVAKELGIENKEQREAEKGSN